MSNNKTNEKRDVAAWVTLPLDKYNKLIERLNSLEAKITENSLSNELNYQWRLAPLEAQLQQFKSNNDHLWAELKEERKRVLELEEKYEPKRKISIDLEAESEESLLF